MYDGKYSITFESIDNGVKKNTWEDWHLIPAAPPMVNPPEAYTNYVDIPGRREGPLDLSEVLSDGPVFLNTEGSWDLIWSDEYCTDMTRVQAFRTVTQFLHGKRFRITFEEDPDTSYIGRIQVSDPKPGASYSTITINYTIQPTNDSPLDVTGTNYVSNSGEIPWYSGPINQNSSSGKTSDSGSGSSGSSSGKTDTTYKGGYNAAIAAAKAESYYEGKLVVVRDPKTGVTSLILAGPNYALSRDGLSATADPPVKVTAYTLPDKRTGTADYDKGWNEARDKFIRKTYYTGSYIGTSSLFPYSPHISNPKSVYAYLKPSTIT